MVCIFRASAGSFAGAGGSPGTAGWGKCAVAARVVVVQFGSGAVHFPATTTANCTTTRGRGLIQLGVLLLIATPVARVVFSAWAFARQRDWTYVLVTLFVLAVLLFGLFYGQPEGGR